MKLLPLALSVMMTVSAASVVAEEAEYPVNNPDVLGEIVQDDGMRTLRVYGQAVAIGDGAVSTWLGLSPGGLYKVGMTLSPEMLIEENLPTTMGHHGGHLNFPRLAGSPFKHAFFAWNPRGHDPSGVYNRPHFDFHLAFIEAEELEAIQFTDPEGQIIPQEGYMPSTSVPQTFPDGSYVNVPGQGVHWFYQDTPEWNGGVFTETFLWGSYNGKNIFMEPMVTYDTIMSEESFEKEIELPRCVDKTAFYPKVYGWEHKQNQAGETYIEVYMKNFVLKHKGGAGC